MSQEKMPWMLEEQLERRATLALKGLILEKKTDGITAAKSRQTSVRNAGCGFFSTLDAAIYSGFGLLNDEDTYEGSSSGLSTILYYDGVYVSAIPLLVSRGDEDNASDEWSLTVSPADYEAPDPYEIGDGYADLAEDASVRDGQAATDLEEASLRLNRRYSSKKRWHGRSAVTKGYFTTNGMAYGGHQAAYKAIDVWRRRGVGSKRLESQWLNTPIGFKIAAK